MSYITEINKLIDSHPDSFVECPGCERCEKIQSLMKSAPKKQRKVLPKQFIADEPVKQPNKITPEIIEEAKKRGISEELLRGRVYKYGMSIPEALSKPIKKGSPFTEEEKARAKANGIKYSTLVYRINKGWDKERALTEPAGTVGGGKKATFTKKEIEEAAKRGIGHNTLMKRLAYGWDKQRAMTEPVEKRFSKKGRATG